MDPAETRMNAEHSVQSIIGATLRRQGETGAVRLAMD